MTPSWSRLQNLDESKIPTKQFPKFFFRWLQAWKDFCKRKKKKELRLKRKEKVRGKFSAQLLFSPIFGFEQNFFWEQTTGEKSSAEVTFCRNLSRSNLTPNCRIFGIYFSDIFFSQTLRLLWILEQMARNSFLSTFVWESQDHANFVCLVPSYHLWPERRRNFFGEAGIKPKSSCFACDRSFHYTIAINLN